MGLASRPACFLDLGLGLELDFMSEIMREDREVVKGNVELMAEITREPGG